MPSLGTSHLYVHPVYASSSKEHAQILCLKSAGLEAKAPGPEDVGFGFVSGPLDLQVPEELELVDYASPKGTLRHNLLILSWHASRTYSEHKADEKAEDVFKCADCKGEVLDTEAEFKALPSPYWAELVDCWSCHKQEFAGVAKHLIEHELILPASCGTVLYCDDHYIVKREGTAEERTMSCAQCGYALGELVRDSCYLIPATRTVRSRGLESDLIRRVLDAVNAHSSFTFAISSYGNDSRQVTFRLVNWTCMLGSGASLRPGLVVCMDEEHGQSACNSEGEQFLYFEEEVDRLRLLLHSRIGIMPNALTFLIGQ